MSDLDSLSQAIESFTITEQSAQATHKQEIQNESSSHTLIHWVFLIIGGFALLNLYTVNSLDQEVGVIIRQMNKMYLQFGEMSERMQSMSERVVSMDQNITLVPVLVEQMEMMDGNIAAMQGNVSSMDESIGGMQQRVSTMNQDTATMSRTFYGVNQRVMQIQRNMGQMANILP